MARVRRLIEEALGDPAGSHYVATHSHWFYAQQMKPWSELAITYHSQPPLGSTASGGEAVPLPAFFNVSDIDISPDGQHLAVLEFRGRGVGDGDPYHLVCRTPGRRRRWRT